MISLSTLISFVINMDIYFLDKLIRISPVENNKPKGSYKEEIDNLLIDIKNNTLESDLTITGNSVKKIFKYLKKNFKYVRAAGGIVKNSENKYLLIKRLGCWDIPKGKIDEGELEGTAAIREVCEETGVCGIKLGKELPSTYHIYFTRNNLCLKRTYWFEMTTSINEKLIPQKKEDISKAKWFTKSKAAEKLSGSYRSISDAFSDYFN